MQNKQTLKAIKLWFLHLFFCTVWCFQSTKYAFYIHLQICTSSNRALRSIFTFLNFVCLARKSLSDQATAITVSWHIGWETSSKYISRQQTIKGGNTKHQTGLSKVQNHTQGWLRHVYIGDLHLFVTNTSLSANKSVNAQICNFVVFKSLLCQISRQCLYWLGNVKTSSCVQLKTWPLPHLPWGG